jgi:putative membrane protein
MEGMHHPAGFAEIWSPSVIVAVVLLGVLYFLAIGPWRTFFRDAEPVGIGRKLSFLAALLLYYVAQGSPLNYYGHNFMFSLHMLQMAIVYLLVPPLVLLGLPPWMLKPFLHNRRIKPWLKPLTHPLFSVMLFNMLFSIYHLPLVLDTLFQVHWLHFVYHYLLLATAFHMWFPIFVPDPEYSRLSGLKKIGYIFADGVLLTPACALIIFANKPLYAHYSSVPEAYTFLDALNDQQLGGVIMKIAQEFIYGIFLAYIFFQWYHMERKREEEEERMESERMDAVLAHGGN